MRRWVDVTETTVVLRKDALDESQFRPPQSLDESVYSEFYLETDGFSFDGRGAGAKSSTNARSPPEGLRTFYSYQGAAEAASSQSSDCYKQFT